MQPEDPAPAGDAVIDAKQTVAVGMVANALLRRAAVHEVAADLLVEVFLEDELGVAAPLVLPATRPAADLAIGGRGPVGELQRVVSLPAGPVFQSRRQGGLPWRVLGTDEQPVVGHDVVWDARKSRRVGVGHRLQVTIAPLGSRLEGRAQLAQVALADGPTGEAQTAGQRRHQDHHQHAQDGDDHRQLR